MACEPCPEDAGQNPRAPSRIQFVSGTDGIATWDCSAGPRAVWGPRVLPALSQGLGVRTCLPAAPGLSSPSGSLAAGSLLQDAELSPPPRGAAGCLEGDLSSLGREVACQGALGSHGNPGLDRATPCSHSKQLWLWLPQEQRRQLGEGLLGLHQQKEAARRRVREEKARQARRAAIQVPGVTKAANACWVHPLCPWGTPACCLPRALLLQAPGRWASGQLGTGRTGGLARLLRGAPHGRSCSRSEPRRQVALSLGC